MFLTSTLKGFNLLKNLFSRINSVVKDDCKLVILVPDNLPMSKGKVAVSCSHAAVLSYIEANRKVPKIANHWLNLGQKKVVLRWDRGITELQNLSKTAAKEKLISVVVRDAGRTEVNCGSVTAVGIGPGNSEEIDKILPRLRLL